MTKEYYYFVWQWYQEALVALGQLNSTYSHCHYNKPWTF